MAAIAGLLIGFTASTLAYRFRILRVPHHSMVARLSEQLKLTPVQRDKIGKISDHLRDKMADLRKGIHKQRRQTLDESYDEIRAVLTPEQRAEFDRIYPATPSEAPTATPSPSP